jgi:flavin reductase (DIM6/NTAB) family NADH-FMN oxidoreductase RutF
MDLNVFFKITYGLYVIGSTNGSKVNGFISNTVFQVTSDPPQIAVASHKNNYSTELIREGKAFTISILRQDYNPDIIGTFGYRSGRDFDKFAQFKYKTGKTGAPILLDDSVGWLECEVVNSVDLGTHILFIGNVIDGEILDDSLVSLTYNYYHEVKKGKAPKNSPTYIDPLKLKAQPGKTS